MALSVRFSRSLDLFGSLPQADYVEGSSLSANTVRLIPIPVAADGTKASYVVFSWTDNFCVKMGTATVVAAMPTSTTDGSGSELNPSARKIDPSFTHISVISTNASLGTMSFFLAPPTS